MINLSEFAFLWRLLRAKGYNSVVRHLRERESNHSHVISTSPPIVLLTWGRDDSTLHQALKERPLTVLYLFYWDINGRVEEIAHSIRQTLTRFPKHRIICLCNESHQSADFGRLGIEAIFFNHNALVSEKIFRPQSAAVIKKWDALYNAQLSPFKRIELACRLDSICLVTYRYADSYDRFYEKRIRAVIPKAFWANEELKAGEKLDPAEIAQLLRQTHCGLCLSESEGAMFASMEYLMTGIPIVTTPSQGGRSVFFDETNSIVCSPDTESVYQAVMEWKARQVNPESIRESVMVKVEEHRQRLRVFVESCGAMIDELFVLDDASTDGGFALIKDLGISCIHQEINLGRGGIRHRAMIEATGDLVVCCDATNVLPPDFVKRALPWFDDPKIAAVYGRIEDPNPRGIVGRWRARHLFKAGHSMEIRHHSPLITYGTMVRRDVVLAVGNFNPILRHSEDTELGERLLAAGYDIVFDPSIPIRCNVQNTLGQVLERYWRWHAGKEERITWNAYWNSIVYSIKGMAWQDLRAGDPMVALISLLCPHFQFWRSIFGHF